MPPSSETTVAPPEPPAATRVAEAQAAAKIACVAAVIGVAVAPPSVVRSSLSPAEAVSRQVLASAQRIEVRSWPVPAGRDVHVLPPSAVRSRVLEPTAYASLALRNVTRLTWPPGRSTGFHETPWSVVSYSSVRPPEVTK